jgi:uncharacterized protein (TIGR03086 family)
MSAGHRELAAAVRSRSTGPDDAGALRTAEGLVADHASAAEEAIAALARDGVLDSDVRLPELGPRPVPARRAIGFHLVDNVAHGWDLARALGVPFEPDAEVLTTALAIAGAIPDSARGAGASFGPALTSGDEPDPMSRFLALVGRSPSWRSA